MNARATAICLVTTVGLVVGMGGCVRRTIAITSTPAEALVYVNDREVGRTPCEVEFLYYGVYDVRLKLDGYESVVGSGTAGAPVWDFIGADLIAEVAPVSLESRVEWHFEMIRADNSPADLLARAQQMRQSVESVPTKSAAESAQQVSPTKAAPSVESDAGNQGAIPAKGSADVPVPPTENPSQTPGQTP